MTLFLPQDEEDTGGKVHSLVPRWNYSKSRKSEIAFQCSVENQSNIVLIVGIPFDCVFNTSKLLYNNTVPEKKERAFF